VNPLQPDARPVGAQPMLDPRLPHERNGLGWKAAAAPVRIARQQSLDTLGAVPIAPGPHRYAAEGEVARGRFQPMLPDIGLGGRFKTDNSWTGKTDKYLTAAETSEFYFEVSSVRKSVCTLVRQLRGPHLSTCA